MPSVCRANKRLLILAVCSASWLAAASDNQTVAADIIGTKEPFASKAVYFVVTDRFVDGDPSNNQEEQGGEYPTFNRPIVNNGQAVANLGYMGGDFLWKFGVAMILFMMYVWWRDIIREGTIEGQHTKRVQKGLRMGMLLFIVSEIMFFFAFF